MSAHVPTEVASDSVAAGRPLSAAQRGIWVHEQLAPSDYSYHLPFILHLNGHVDRPALRAACAMVLDRHDQLRVRIVSHGDDPRQYVLPADPAFLDAVLSEADLSAEPPVDPYVFAQGLGRRQLRLAEGPLIQMVLATSGENRHHLIVMVHHIIFDGKSLCMMLAEIAQIYNARLEGREPVLSPPNTLTAERLEEERTRLSGDLARQHADFWRATTPDSMGSALLPRDRPPSPALSPGGVRATWTIDEGLWRQVVACAARVVPASTNVLFISILQTLLRRYGNGGALCVNTGMSTRRAETGDVVGLFVNNVPVITEVNGDPTFVELMDAVNRSFRPVLRHRDLPLAEILHAVHHRGDAGGSPLFQVLLSVLPCPPFPMHGLETWLEIVHVGAKADLLLEVIIQGSGAVVTVEGPAEHFDQATIERIVGHLRVLLGAAVGQPERRLSELAMLTDGELHQLVEWNGAVADLPAEQTIHALVEAQVARTPAASAIVCGERALTYAQLDARANQLAHHLRSLGVGPEVLVGVCVERGVDLVVGQLAILKAGGAYVPLDPDHPVDRLALMLADCGAQVLVTRSPLLHRLPDGHRARAVCLDADWPVINAQPATPPRSAVDAGNLAYVIYTSGSTGQPKGVMIEHRGVTNLVHWHRRTYGVGPEDRVTQVAAVGFDATVWELWPSLASGASVRVPGPEVRESPERLWAWLESEGITLSFLPTPLAESVLIAGWPAPPGLRTLLTGGDRLRRRPAASQGLDLVNHYGPTECTVVATSARVHASAMGNGDAAPPIGGPIANTRAYVLDGHRAHLPIGMAGELYLGGVGVARGYLHGADLTAERFLPDPFAADPGARMYRTGDRVRRLPDGTLDFLGRLDRQVKIRGHRIECGEVEAALLAHPRVSQAVVTARHDEGAEPRLVAHLVTEGDGALTTTELRTHLRRSLPDYMVPAAFVGLVDLPLTPNGKVDHAALPCPDRRPELEAEYIAPRTPSEEMLAAVWAELLGVDRVGVHDNFFDLGGDSIVSIQIVSRARRRGIALSPRLLFDHPTVAGLAAAAAAADAPGLQVGAEQGEVTGPVPLTPIQRWFFDQELREPHHFNQSASLELTAGVDPHALAGAMRALVAHHDALRLRFHLGPGGWHQEHAGVDTADRLVRVDLGDTDPEREHVVVEKHVRRLQAGLDLSAGPLIAAVLFDRGARRPATLVVVIHHLAVDGVSWQILLEDLLTAYDQLRAGATDVRLPAKTTPFQRWAGRLVEHAGGAALRAQLGLWLDDRRRAVRPLPVDHSDGENTVASAGELTVALGAGETRKLLHRVPAAYRTRINDILLTALAQALTAWTGSGSPLLVDLEGHGREPLFDDVDLSRTVGWFTVISPLLLELDPGADTATALKAVKEQLRSVPDGGIGYGLLRYLCRDSTVPERLAALPAAEVGLNYLGQLGTGARWAPLSGDGPAAGLDRSAAGRRTHLIDLDCAVVGDRLRLRWTYSRAIHDETTVAGVASSFLDALHQLIEHCCSPGVGGCTPSDFPLAGVDQATLDRHFTGERLVEDLYPLSSMQQGILFHCLYTPQAGEYVQQFCFRLGVDVDTAVLERAWALLIDRHAILRSSIVWEGVDRPLQAVHQRVRVAVQQSDQRLQAFLVEDRRRPIDLTAAPLMRLTLLEDGDGDRHLVWTFHHLLLDGWSVPIVLSELRSCYGALQRGEHPALPAPRPYRDYIASLAGMDTATAEAWWRKELHGFDTPTRLPAGEPALAGVSVVAQTEPLWLSEETTAILQELVRRGRLTLNTILQGAWGLVLGRYAGSRDVVFGATVSSRAAALTGMESMVGLLINTLPVRVRLDPEHTVLRWLGELQSRQLEAREHMHAPLVAIQGWSELLPGTPLFDTLMVFENYPSDDLGGKRGDPLELDLVAVVEQTNYPLTLVVMPGPRLAIIASYDAARLQPDVVARVLDHLQVVLRQIAVTPDLRLSDLCMLTDTERRRLVEWNDTATGLPAATTVHALVEEQVTRTPDHLAVTDDERTLTYAHLDARANQLAHHLMSLGAGTGTLVGVCLQRGVDMLVALLAILKAGGAYLPLDPDFPAPRLALMLDDSQVPLLLTQSALLPSLPVGHRAQVVCLDTDSAAVDAHPQARPGALCSDTDLTYVIYTSGSTGTPKGVMVEHRAVVNFLHSMRRRPGIGAGDVLLAVTTLSFDIAALELLLPLTTGARVAIAGPRVAADGARLARRIAETGATVMQATPSTWRMLLDAGWEGDPRLRILCGGEALDRPLATRLLTRGAELWNLYGPTETTIWSALHRVEHGDGPVPIGRPIANTSIHLLDASLQPVPIGVAGELCIGGTGVARGYLHRPELTAERFLPDPFSDRPGARIYRTGDLARRRADGTVECLGRLDHQVKIRGHRIECGEVEAALLSHPRVRQVAVVARDEEGGERRLVAYVVAPGGGVPTTSELRAHLLRTLPEYMVPAAFVGVDALPRTPNGKLDRAALPAPDTRPVLEAGYVAPRTPTEEVLASIWAELLGVDCVGVHDNFFELGGHSLLATRVVSRIRAALGVGVSLRELFDAPTVTGLARIAEGSRLEQLAPSPPLVPVSRDHPLPLSFAQERLWILQQLEPESMPYIIPLGLRLAGPLDVMALEEALSDLVARHEALRTTFPAVDGRPVQVISPPEPVHIDVSDLSALPRTQRESEVRRLSTAIAQQPFDLARGPLLRVHLLRLNGQDHVLLWMLHHIVVDGWSLGLLTAELGAAYGARLRGQRQALPDLPIQLADFAAWQRRWLSGEVLDSQLAYWRRRLAGSPPVMELPTDHPRTARPGDRGGIAEFTISARATAGLTALARAHGVTLFMTLLAAFQTLLARYTGSRDIVVGTPIAGRTRPETDQVVGLFINSLVLRTDLSGDPAFVGLLSRVRETVLDAYAHQDVPFERLVEELRPDRDTGRNPLFQVMLSLNNLPQQSLHLQGVTVTGLAVDLGAAKFDLSLSFTETPDGLHARVDYIRDLFEEATIARLVDHLQTLLAQLLTHPEARLSELSILTESERRQLLEWNDTATAPPAARTVHGLVEEQAARTPSATAVVDGAQALSYAELDARSNRLARHLRTLGVGPDVLVGICMERSVELMVGLLGILKAGGAYLPLDPDYPAQRLAFMLEDSAATVVLTHSTLLGLLAGLDAPRAVCIDTDAPLIDAQPGSALEVGASAENLAYVIYTSGSTGHPKGAMNTHGGVVNRLHWMQGEYPLRDGDRVLQKTPISFDVSVWELFWPLASGACVVEARPGGHRDPAYLVDVIAGERISTLHFVPSMLRVFLEEGGLDRCTSLRRVICSGEALSRELQDRFFDRLHGVDLHNLYGPTEAAIDVTAWHCRAGELDPVVPIGRPIANTQVHVLGHDRAMLPVGVPGELYIGGVGVARGYHNRPELTADRFLPDPFSDRPGARLYRTGDLVRRRPDGVLEFIGRLDHQVKIRGNRVECGEVEATLLVHPEVREAVVMARDGDGEARLVAYLVAASDKPPAAATLRAHLILSLPEYMVPTTFVVVDGLPLTPSGKLDRSALPAPGCPAAGEKRAPVPPRTELERRLAWIFTEVLGLDRVGVEDNFFDLGGHSLLAARVVSRIRDALDVELQLRSLFDAPTVAGIAAAVERTPRERPRARPQLVALPRPGS